MKHWVVVGAGSAGCVLANRLLADPDRHVTLIDDGPDLAPTAVPPGIDGASFLDALAEPGRTHPDLLATRTTHAEPKVYLRGRGVGGSSAVNAMVALRGSPAIYESWGWQDAEAAWARVEIPAVAAEPDELGAVDRALLAADPAAERALLTRRDGRRVTSAEAYVWPVRTEPNLTVRPDTAVDQLIVRDRSIVGVRCTDGSTIDADRVVLAAGAIHTPAILLRSGIDTPGIGAGLQDHPAAPLTLQLRAGVEQTAAGLVVGTLLHHTTGGQLTQILPMNHLGREAPGLALLMPALMTPASRHGTVSLDTDGQPVIDFALLHDPRDVAALAGATRFALDLLARPAFDDIVEQIYIDDQGTTAAALRDDEELTKWLLSRAGDYVHASSTCAMGSVVDEHHAVRGYAGLSVCDASIFPHIPDVNTHLPVTMAAERFCLRETMRP